MYMVALGNPLAEGLKFIGPFEFTIDAMAYGMKHRPDGHWSYHKLQEPVYAGTKEGVQNVHLQQGFAA